MTTVRLLCGWWLSRKVVFAVLVLMPGRLNADIVIFSTNFNGGIPIEFSGAANSLEGVQGFAGLGPPGNQFSGNFLRNGSVGNPATSTVLTLTGLPAHTAIDLDWLGAIIDSWDGHVHSVVSPDLLNVRVDGVSIFSNDFWNSSAPGPQGYSPPPGIMLAFQQHLGFLSGGDDWRDSAYNFGLDSILDNIAHTADTLTIEWFASGSGWQGTWDESWAIDNVKIRLIGAIPEPSAMPLLFGSIVAPTAFARRQRATKE